MNKPTKKTVLFLTRIHTPHVGGVENHIDCLSQQLKTNFSINIITSQHDEALAQTERTNNATIYRIPNNNEGENKVATWQWLWHNRKLFQQADIIHIHDVFWWILPLWPLIRSKLYITFHGYEGSEPPTTKQIFWHRLAALLTKGNICVGDFHKKWYGVEPTIVSYGASSPTKSKEKKSKTKRKHFVYIGRLHHDTGILSYLEALHEYQQTEKKFFCDIYGDGPLRRQAEEFAIKHKLPVSFHGFVANAAQFIPQADVIFVSRYLAIIEALQAGVPIIAQYNNPIKYDYLALAPFAQWITIAQDAQGIAAALTSVSSPPKTATKWANQQTWNTVANDYQTLWQKNL